MYAQYAYKRIGCGARRLYKHLKCAGRSQLVANRFLWNKAVAKGKYAETGRTRASWFTLNARYKEWKDDKHPWLKQYTTANTRPMLRRFAKAHRREFKDGKGFPRFKKKGRAKPSFDVDLPGSKGKHIKDNQFRVREERWMVKPDRHFGYSNPVPKSATVYEELGKFNNAEPRSWTRW